MDFQFGEEMKIGLAHLLNVDRTLSESELLHTCSEDAGSDACIR